ncbi:two-component system, CitB family, sensor histidine kinase DctS [Geosporobacter subterraneus DSM 17957]|uniref:histidine kinase n=1 Tax=Geosporobacter subterraneus DSM 17957 TaxID=1121919 RepID=A0A1M6FVG2_9FIRM|nr:sensor histidine kinase [Geosporobacter subterraneus]SHJ01632.1 two-component system, CitB family, sensor histidine kinase DctS [Geosporobacter subterraneus DSM 17957]
MYGKATLRIKIIIFTTLMVMVLLTGVGTFSLWYIDNSIHNVLGKNALNIGKTVSLIRDIQVHVGQARGEWVIQPLIEDIRRATSAEYIVVMDMQGIRYAHPTFSKVGKIYLGGDEKQAFLGKSYISKGEGSSGPSIKAYAPIYRDGQQVGVVVVSMLYPHFTKFLTEIESGFYYILLGGFFLTIFGSALLARNIKNQIMGLEPEEIAKLLKERHIILQTVKEGIIAVDHQYRITMINGEGKKILKLNEDVIGRDIREIVQNSHMPEVIESGIPEHDREHILDNNRAIVANTLPINIKGEVVGAVSSFRDLTDLRNLAEQLTGVKRFIDALRAQNHEFLNKLHTIYGLLQLKSYDEAIKYIDSISEIQEEMLGFLAKNIKDDAISGLLLAKYNKMQELKIDFTMDPSSKLSRIETLDTNILVTIIGNLLENAMDAVSGMEKDKRKVSLTLNDGNEELEIIVTDTGEGIEDRHLSRVFDFGFTTKVGENKGVGLALVKQIIDSLEGTILLDSQKDIGTEAIVSIPKKYKVVSQ